MDSWKLATINMWLDKLNNHEVIKLIGDNFDWDELWEAAAEINQLCADRGMSCKIPKNRDQGDQRDRVGVLCNALLLSLGELKARSDCPVFVVTSANLSKVPGVIKDTMKVEPAVTARLDNIEKMVENLTRDFSVMKTEKLQHFPALQVNGVQGGGHGQGGAQVEHHQLGARARNFLGAGQQPIRSRSPSVKRPADEAQMQLEEGNNQQQGQSWTDVVRNNQGRRQRPVQYGTAKVNVAGSEARPYDIVVGNTNPASTEEIIREVLTEVAKGATGDHRLEEPLQILEVECLTKPREDGSRIWTKTWRVQVPNKFREHMLRPESYPAGWTSRRYFPPRHQRPAVPDLYPTGGAHSQPPGKRPNLSQ